MTLRNFIKHLSRITSTRSFSQPPHHHHRRHSDQEPPHQPDPFSLLKEDPIEVISSLWIKAQTHTNKPFTNLTGFLSKLDLWVLSYQRTCAHVTGSFPPRTSLPSHILLSLLSLRNAVVRGHFLWNSQTQLYILSPSNHNKSLSSASSFQDRIVQEVLLLILEPIFEPRFSFRSHGFWPGRNPHKTAKVLEGNVIRVRGCVGKAVKEMKVLGLINRAFIRAPVNNGARCRSGGKDEEEELHAGQRGFSTISRNLWFGGR